MLAREVAREAARTTASREALSISTICVEILWNVGGNRDRAAFRVTSTAVERGGELVVQSTPTHAAMPTRRRMLFWTPWVHHITILPPPPSHGLEAWDRWVVLWHETPGPHQGAGGLGLAGGPGSIMLHGCSSAGIRHHQFVEGRGYVARRVLWAEAQGLANP